MLERAGKCRADPLTESIVCRSYPTVRLVLESDPPRFTKRILKVATINKYGEGSRFEKADNRTFWSVGPFPQSISCQKHFAQFHWDVEVAREYSIYTSGVLQDYNRLSFHSEDPNKCVLAKVFFNKPQTVRVTKFDRRAPEQRGQLVPALNRQPTIDDKSGSNRLDPQMRLLSITMCGGPDKAYWLDYGSLVQVTATIKMSTEEFFGSNVRDQRKGLEQFVTNAAQLLGVELDMVKVTCVHAPGQPCLLLDSARRGRRADPNAAAVVAPVLNYTVIEFTISPPDCENDLSLSTTKALCAKATKVCGINGVEEVCQVVPSIQNTQALLVAIAETILSKQESGDLAAGFASAGYDGFSLTIDFDLLTTDDASGSGSGADKLVSCDDTIFFDADGNEEMSLAECRAAGIPESHCSTLDSNNDGVIVQSEYDVVEASLCNTTVASSNDDGMGAGPMAAMVFGLLIGLVLVFVVVYKLQAPKKETGKAAYEHTNPSFDPLSDSGLTVVRGSVHGDSVHTNAKKSSYYADRSRAQLQQDSLFGGTATNHRRNSRGKRGGGEPVLEENNNEDVSRAAKVETRPDFSGMITTASAAADPDAVNI
jgi:hypothetical protein